MVDMDFKWDNTHSIANMQRRLQEIRDTVDSSLPDHAEVIAISITRDAKDIVRVDTGKLRASIDYDVQTPSEMVVKILVGTNVYYSVFVEVDYPFLRPAFNQNHDTIRNEIQSALRNLT